MRITLLCAVFAAALTGVSVMGRPADGNGATVQLVYHSDTRGYYLPCG